MRSRVDKLSPIVSPLHAPVLLCPAVPKGHSAPAAPAAAAGAKPAAAGCADWSLPPLADLSKALEEHKAAAERKAKKRAADVQLALETKREVDNMGRVYDWGGAPFEDPASKRRSYVS